MDELLFNGMDIPNETEKFLKRYMDKLCNEMNESEKMAFNLGVGNTLASLRSILEMDEEPVVHIKGLNELEEMTLEELEEIFLD